MWRRSADWEYGVTYQKGAQTIRRKAPRGVSHLPALLGDHFAASNTIKSLADWQIPVFFNGPRGGKRRAGVARFFLRREEMFTMGSLFPRFTSAGMGKTHHAYFRLPRLSDRLAFGTSADGDHCGRHGCSSCSTRWNAITPRRRGRGFTEYLGLAFSFTRKPHPF
jgi:hypothetical protein